MAVYARRGIEDKGAAPVGSQTLDAIPGTFPAAQIVEALPELVRQHETNSTASG